MSEKPIVQIIQERMDDPNYIPTGPTYGELKQRAGWQAEDNSMSDPVLAERERCAKIADGYDSDESLRSRVARDIAASIRADNPSREEAARRLAINLGWAAIRSGK